MKNPISAICKKWVGQTCEMLLGSMFIVSSLIHFTGPYFFLEAAIRYRIVNGDVLVWLLPFLTGLQFSIGICLVFGLARRAALISAASILFMFLVSQLIVLFRGIEVSCGCFGTSSHKVDVISVSKLFLLVLVCGFLVWSMNRERQNCTDSTEVLT